MDRWTLSIKWGHCFYHLTIFVQSEELRACDFRLVNLARFLIIIKLTIYDYGYIYFSRCLLFDFLFKCKNKWKDQCFLFFYGTWECKGWSTRLRPKSEWIQFDTSDTKMQQGYIASLQRLNVNTVQTNMWILFPTWVTISRAWVGTSAVRNYIWVK